MVNSLLYLLYRVLFRSLLRIGGSEAKTELENVVLRHQLMVLKRRLPRTRVALRDRVFMTAAARFLPRAALAGFIVSPQTFLRWHRQLVSRKWARYSRRPRGPGRPQLPQETQELILRIAKENERWGYRRVHGELVKLGVKVSATAVRMLLRRNGLGPAPRREMQTWTHFLSMQAKTVLACDFFTVDTLFLKRIYVLFFIEIANRRVHFAGSTANPNGQWVTQQARNMFMATDFDYLRFLIRDRDAKFSGTFDEVFLTEGFTVMKTPYRSPRANAFAERWIKTVRNECLDHLLILGWRHLGNVMRIFVEHYNMQRPHRSLGLRPPMGDAPVAASVADISVKRRDLLGGLVHEYFAQLSDRPEEPHLLESEVRARSNSSQCPRLPRPTYQRAQCTKETRRHRTVRCYFHPLTVPRQGA